MCTDRLIQHARPGTYSGFETPTRDHDGYPGMQPLDGAGRLRQATIDDPTQSCAPKLADQMAASPSCHASEAGVVLRARGNGPWRKRAQLPVLPR